MKYFWYIIGLVLIVYSIYKKNEHCYTYLLDARNEQKFDCIVTKKPYINGRNYVLHGVDKQGGVYEDAGSSFTFVKSLQFIHIGDRIVLDSNSLIRMERVNMEKMGRLYFSVQRDSQVFNLLFQERECCDECQIPNEL